MSYSNMSIWAALPRTQRGQPIVLGVDPKGTKLLYAHGNSVIIRDLVNPAISDIYTEHSIQVNVAKFAPSGYYICSGDQHGKVRIWDTVNPEHLLKAEYQPLGGPIRDIVWSHDSQRICVVGEGRGKFAHVFMLDTGASVKGDLSGHTKAINSVDWKQSRPFRIVTGSEDNKVAFYEGPPFIFKCTKTDHTKYVHSVRYSPNGELFATGGFDGKVMVFDGKEAELKMTLGSPAHKGGVNGVTWSPDSKQLLTASGDKSCKIWDVQTGQLVTEFVMGTEVEDQQMSCLWTCTGHLISVSLSGFINFLDPQNSSKHKLVIKGHNKPITRSCLTSDSQHLYTASADGTIIVWDVATGSNDRICGKGHGNQVTGIVVKNDVVYTCGIDDTIKIIDPLMKVYNGVSISLGSQPKHIAAIEDGVITVTTKELIIFRNDKRVGGIPLDYGAMCVAVNLGSPHPEVAVGAEDFKIHIYKLTEKSVTELKTITQLGSVTDLSFSPCTRYLVSCDTNRKVIPYDVATFEKVHKTEWGFHNARINTVAWSPDSRYVASGALDTQIIVWSMSHPDKHIIIRNSHPQSQVNGLVWLDNERLASVGHDGLIKIWSVSL